MSTIPEMSDLIHTTFGSAYSSEKGNPDENPGAYLVFEDVVKKLMFNLLETGKDEKLLTRLFSFFEGMANSTDPNVARDLLGIAIIEPLVYKKAAIGAAWKFMGPKMRELAASEATSTGRQENLPTA
jgi:hypothetical protein